MHDLVLYFVSYCQFMAFSNVFHILALLFLKYVFRVLFVNSKKICFKFEVKQKNVIVMIGLLHVWAQ